MTHSDFRLGCEFTTGSGKKWRCTDIGQRVIVAVCLDDHLDDESWYNGPPYAVAEQVFDEYDQEGCDPTTPSPASDIGVCLECVQKITGC
jgi:hypothetical protein